MEQLKAISEIAVSRTLNWQAFCTTQPRILAFLVKAAICLDEAISPILLQVRTLKDCYLLGRYEANLLAATGKNFTKLLSV